MRPIAILFVALASALPAVAADSVRFVRTIEAGPHDRSGLPVGVFLYAPHELAKIETAVVITSNGETLCGAGIESMLLSPVSINDIPIPSPREVWFVPKKFPAGSTLECEVTVSANEPPAPEQRFAWRDTPGKHAECTFAGRPLLRYEYQPLDESSRERRNETYKVFHHVYNPTGTTLLTKGPGGTYPHHRGLFYGFNKVSYDGGKKKADVWHCTGEAFQANGTVAPTSRTAAGPVFGRHEVEVLWHGPQKEHFASEERELTLFRLESEGQPAVMIDFASRLHARFDDLKLDGDPQHAGFHFRAAEEVAASTKSQTYYLRPDGIGKPGATRNWPDDKSQVNLPWKGMSFVVAGQRYTVIYMNHPVNPRESRFSERDYGRFGCYFEHQFTAERPKLEVRYRLWIVAGEMTVEQAARLANDFAAPVNVNLAGKTERKPEGTNK